MHCITQGRGNDEDSESHNYRIMDGLTKLQKRAESKVNRVNQHLTMEVVLALYDVVCTLVVSIMLIANGPCTYFQSTRLNEGSWPPTVVVCVGVRRSEPNGWSQCDVRGRRLLLARLHVFLCHDGRAAEDCSHRG